MWTHKPKDLSIRQFFEERFNREENGNYGKILDCAVVNLRTAYIAYEIGDAQGKREIVAVVCALGYAPNSHYNFGYKDMDESMGPCECDCPERILKLLTPTEHEWAKEWREKCWENIRARKARPRLKEGMMIEFDYPLSFSDGWEGKKFTIIDPCKLIFAAEPYGGRCRIRRSTIRRGEWKVVTAQVIQSARPALDSPN